MAFLKLCLGLTLLAVNLADGVSENYKPSQLPTQTGYGTNFTGLAKVLAGLNREEQVAFMNEYIDVLLGYLNRYIDGNNLEPLILPTLEASSGSGFWRAWVALKNGRLHGLSTLKRTGEVIVVYNYPNLKIYMPLGFSNVNFKYRYEMKVIGLGPAGNVKGSSRFNVVAFNLNINMVNTRVGLDAFKFDLGWLDLKFEGLPILVPINTILKLITPILEPSISSVLSSTVTGLLTNVLNTYNNAVCTLLDDCPELEKAVYQQLPTLI